MSTQEQIQQVARARLEPGTIRLQVWHANHSAMLPPEHTLVCTLVHCLIPQNTKQRPKLAFLSSFTRSQPLGHFCIGKRSFWMVKIQETFWATYFKVNNYYYCWLNLSIALSFVHLLLINGTPFMYLQSWTNVLGHFCISGVFSNSHRPDPSPHPTNNVWRVYPEFFPSFNLYRVGEGELWKILKKMHCFMREPRATVSVLTAINSLSF